jgi:hypothetical protein
MTMLRRGLAPDDVGVSTIRQGSAGSKSPPRFLAQAWGWVEFQRIALRQQGQYAIDSSADGDSEPLTHDRPGSVQQRGRDRRVLC